MNKAFEKILERLEEMIHPKQLYFCKYARGGCRYLYNDKDCMDCVVELAKEIVQEVAEEYKKETYFNLDNVTLHKCPKCGGNAQHRVNQRGSWACGCFECGLFKSDYDHQKAIQEWEDYCKEYNNGWIPCSERLPEEYGEYLVWWTDITGKRYYEITEYEPENGWIGDIPQAVEGKYNVIAWQPLPKPYQPKGE